MSMEYDKKGECVWRRWRKSGLKIKGTNPYVISVIFVSLCNPFYEADPLERERRTVG